MTITDRTIDSIGLPSHPKPKQLARYLRTVATLLESDGTRAENAATLLAARGWAAGTLGDGTGARSTSTITSVERAIGIDDGDGGLDPGRWIEIERQLHRTLRLLWKTGLLLEERVAEVLSHGDDVDELPAGTGNCGCCSRFCRPGVTGGDEDRLRAGLCPACRSAWDRAGKPEKGAWVIDRRRSLREGLDRGRNPRELIQRGA